MKLAVMLRRPEYRWNRTIAKATGELKERCLNDSVFAELQRATLFLVEGDVNKQVFYWTKGSDRCGLGVVTPEGRPRLNAIEISLAFLTKNDFITRVLVQEHKINQTEAQLEEV
jgi:hypothetical protein